MLVETINTISPSTNQSVLTRSGSTSEEIQKIIDQSQTAYESFKNTTLESRQAIVRKVLDLMHEHEQELAKELTAQIGRPINISYDEIVATIDRGEHLLKYSTDALAETPGEDEPGFKRFIRKTPVGPTFLLFAWNFPYNIIVNSIVPAILSGNTVIMKPSPQAPSVAEHMQKYFEEAGTPKHVVQYFHSSSFAQVQDVIKDPRIKLVCFTGSVAGGLAVKQAASNRIDIRVGLELGGKCPAYVREDASDLAWTAKELVHGATFNAGQSCCSVERIYVHDKIYDNFIKALQEEMKSLVLGDTFDQKTTMGPVISKQSKSAIERHIKDALDKGARDATPENASFKSPPSEGNYLAPVLLVDTTHDMIVMRDETFGPVIAVSKVTSDDEAVRLMNDTDLGLTASVWTKNVEEGLTLIERIEAGTVFINRCEYPSPDLPWIGWKASGQGHTLSKFGFEQFYKLKSFHVRQEEKS